MLSSDATRDAAASEPNNPGSSGRSAEIISGERTPSLGQERNRIILRSPSYDITADTALRCGRAVEASNYAPIIAVLNIERSARIAPPSSMCDAALHHQRSGDRGDPRHDRRHPILRGARPRFPDNVEIEATRPGRRRHRVEPPRRLPAPSAPPPKAC